MLLQKVRKSLFNVCYRVAKPNVALSYMLKALAIESKDGSSGTRCSQAGTKLNVCAILSS
jgi:hypothetical protein